MAKKVHLVNELGDAACGSKGNLKTDGKVTCKNCISKMGRKLYELAEEGKLEEAKKLIAKGEISFFDKEECEWAFVKASEKNHLRVVEYLYDQFNIGNDTFTKAACALVKRDKPYGEDKTLSDSELFTLGYLLDHGGDPTKTLEETANRSPGPRTVEFLLNKGANPGAGLGPAASLGNFELMQTLLDRGADINYSDVVYILAEKIDPRSYYAKDRFDEHKGMLRVLIERGATITDKAFMSAIYRKNLEAFNLMLEHGANINAEGQTRYGNKPPTAVGAAMLEGCVEMVVTLLKRGADPTTLPKETRQLFSLLSVEQFTEIKDIISINEVMSA